MFWGSGGSKSRLAKAAGAEPSGQMRDENCTPLWCETDFEVKMQKAPHCRITFGSWDVQKVHTAVVRSIFRSQHIKKHLGFGALLEVQMNEKVQGVVGRNTFWGQNAKSTPCSEHFWKLRCLKSARRCGVKHRWKSKGKKTQRVRSTLGS